MCSLSVDSTGVHMSGQSGYCDCRESITSPYSANDATAHDDNGLKCLASNGKPCLFPFKYKGKVIIPD